MPNLEKIFEDSDLPTSEPSDSEDDYINNAKGGLLKLFIFAQSLKEKADFVLSLSGWCSLLHEEVRCCWKSSLLELVGLSRVFRSVTLNVPNRYLSQPAELIIMSTVQFKQALVHLERVIRSSDPVSTSTVSDLIGSLLEHSSEVCFQSIDLVLHAWRKYGESAYNGLPSLFNSTSMLDLTGNSQPFFADIHSFLSAGNELAKVLPANQRVAFEKALQKVEETSYSTFFAVKRCVFNQNFRWDQERAISAELREKLDLTSSCIGGELGLSHADLLTETSYCESWYLRLARMFSDELRTQAEKELVAYTFSKYLTSLSQLLQMLEGKQDSYSGQNFLPDDVALDWMALRMDLPLFISNRRTAVEDQYVCVESTLRLCSLEKRLDALFLPWSSLFQEAWSCIHTIRPGSTHMSWKMSDLLNMDTLAALSSKELSSRIVGELGPILLTTNLEASFHLYTDSVATIKTFLKTVHDEISTGCSDIGFIVCKLNYSALKYQVFVALHGLWSRCLCPLLRVMGIRCSSVAFRVDDSNSVANLHRSAYVAEFLSALFENYNMSRDETESSLAAMKKHVGLLEALTHPAPQLVETVRQAMLNKAYLTWCGRVLELLELFSGLVSPFCAPLRSLGLPTHLPERMVLDPTSLPERRYSRWTRWTGRVAAVLTSAAALVVHGKHHHDYLQLLNRFNDISSTIAKELTGVDPVDITWRLSWIATISSLVNILRYDSTCPPALLHLLNSTISDERAEINVAELHELIETCERNQASKTVGLDRPTSATPRFTSILHRDFPDSSDRTSLVPVPTEVPSPTEDDVSPSQM